MTAPESIRPSVNIQVGELVHQEIWRQKRTQVEVAEALGIAQATLSRKLRGTRPWELDELYDIAELLGVPVTKFLPEQENPRPGDPDGGLGVRHQGLEPRTR